MRRCKTRTNEHLCNMREQESLRDERVFETIHIEFESQLSVVVLKHINIKHSLRKLSLTTSHYTTLAIGAFHLNRCVKKCSFIKEMFLTFHGIHAHMNDFFIHWFRLWAHMAFAWNNVKGLVDSLIMVWYVTSSNLFEYYVHLIYFEKYKNIYIYWLK